MKSIQEGRRGTQVDERDEGSSWLMSSASGRERFLCTRIAPAKISRCSLYKVEVNGNFWDKGVPLAEAGISPDFQVQLPQVLFSDDALVALRGHINSWLEERTHFECLMTPELNSDQILTIAIGSDSGLISSKDKPVFIVNYSRGSAMVGRWAFVIDQSCVRGFIDG